LSSIIPSLAILFPLSHPHLIFFKPITPVPIPSIYFGGAWAEGGRGAGRERKTDSILN